jgi:hypothetical protein
METHGCLLQVPQPEIWWWYPDSGAATNKSAICLNLVTGAVTAQSFAHSITASASWLSQGSLTYATLPGTFGTLPTTYPTYDSLTSAAQPTSVLGSSVGVIDQFGLALDDRGTAIAWEVVPGGWRALNGGGRVYMDGVRTYCRKTSSALTVTVGLTVTDALDDNATEQTSTFDMSTSSNHMVTFPGTVGRFAKVRLAASSQVEAIEIRGTQALAWPRGAT